MELIYKKLRAYLTLMRPIGWVPFWFALIFGLIDAGFKPLTNVYLSFFIFGPLIVGGIYTLNFYSDRELDRQSKVEKDVVMRKQPFVTGVVGEKEGLLLSFILILSGLILSYFLINKVVFSLGLLLLVIGIIYSFPPRLKGIPFADVLANSAGVAMGYLIGWSTLKDVSQVSIYPVFWIFLLIAATYLLTVLIDIEEDKHAGLRTSATYLGIKKTATLSLYLFLSSFIFYFLTLIDNPKINYFFILPFLLISVFVYYNELKNPNIIRIYRLAKGGVKTSAIILFSLLILYSFVVYFYE